MAMPDTEGTYHAEVLEAAYGKSTSGTPRVTFKFRLTEIAFGVEWDAVADDLDIIGDVYIKKADGTLNRKAIDNLRDTFGWPGDDPFWFEDTLDRDGALNPCQVEIGWDEYRGERKLKVNWVNPYDRVPGGSLRRASGAEREAMLEEISADLRAVGGVASTEAPRRAAPPAQPPAPPASAEDEEAAGRAMNETYALHDERCGLAGIDNARRDDMYFAAVKKVCGHERTERVTAAEWVEVAKALQSALVEYKHGEEADARAAAGESPEPVGAVG